MDIKQTIFETAQKKKKFKTSDVVRALKGKVTRQYISSIINNLVKKGELAKGGSTASASYALPQNKEVLMNVIKKRILRGGLKEHEVLDDINHQPLLSDLHENVRSIFDYAFSEMLNNAIDHSQSKYIEIEVVRNTYNISFTVSDFGIGVFRNVIKKRKLNSELDAMQDLLKGKTTTQPHAHSGEGIFFTSKTADTFNLESFGYLLRVDNIINDVFFQEVKPVKRGTRVNLIISIHSKRHLRDVFNRYETDHENPDFDKTEVLIKLYTIGTIYISRSQARRLLSGLDKFKLIILDFDKVPTVGQAFADEIFRVFLLKNPEIELKPINMNEAVKYMIDRVDKPNNTNS